MKDLSSGKVNKSGSDLRPPNSHYARF